MALAKILVPTAMFGRLVLAGKIAPFMLALTCAFGLGALFVAFRRFDPHVHKFWTVFKFFAHRYM